MGGVGLFVIEFCRIREKMGIGIVRYKILEGGREGKRGCEIGWVFCIQL